MQKNHRKKRFTPRSHRSGKWSKSINPQNKFCGTENTTNRHRLKDIHTPYRIVYSRRMEASGWSCRKREKEREKYDKNDDLLQSSGESFLFRNLTGTSIRFTASIATASLTKCNRNKWSVHWRKDANREKKTIFSSLLFWIWADLV